VRTTVAVSGVYSTIHLDSGDIDTTEVRSVTIDGLVTTFQLTRPHVPRDGTFEWTTLHVGPLMKRMRVSPTTLRRDDDVTVVQPIELLGIS
jgi:hypothetical protein